MMGKRQRAFAPRANALMVDTCALFAPNGATRDATGYLAQSFTTGVISSCRMVMTRRDETLPFTTGIPDDRATVWLPADTVVTPAYQVVITHRAGQLLARPLRYTVTGEPEQSPVHVKLDCRAVVDHDE